MKKILFILGMYQPRPSANGICSEQVVKELIDNGYDVTCIVNKESNSPNMENLKGAKVHRIKTRLTYRLFEWAEYNKPLKSAIYINKIALIMNKLKNFIFVFTWPLVSPGYTFNFYSKAKKLHIKENFDAVISVYTPIDSLIAGYLLKRKFPQVKYIPYFLDSLSGGWGPKYFSEKRIIKRGKMWEDKLLEKADVIVAMRSSEIHHKQYNLKSSYYNKINFLDIPLMVKQEYEENKVALLDKSKINIVYIGSIPYPVRNPKFILRIIEKLNRDDVVITFVGRNNCQDIFLKAQQGMGDRLKVMDNVPHKTAIAIANEANILINIGNANPSMIPCKIFEYMAVGKPIISTYSISNEPSIPYLQKYPTNLLLDERIEDDAEQISKLIKFIDMYGDEKNDFYDLITNFYDNTPKAFVKMLDCHLKR